jgi:anti-sigma regulatory factor (Ser/Thr protein kinase)
MTAVGPPLVLDCEDVAWFRDQPEAARGAAAALGRRTGLGEHRTAELVLAVAELATNMTKHAVDGSLLLRVLRDRVVAGVEVVVVDGVAAGRSVAVRDSVAGPGDGILVMSCDGLGHGPMAALAATAAVQAFRTGTSARTPEQVVEHVHRALRGAAVAVARLEPGGRVLFCGVGNISAVLVTAGTRAGLLSHPGIVGHQMHQLRTYERTWPGCCTTRPPSSPPRCCAARAPAATTPAPWSPRRPGEPLHLRRPRSPAGPGHHGRHRAGRLRPAPPRQDHRGRGGPGQPRPGAPGHRGQRTGT